MMKSYTLNNWDGQLSNAETQTTQNTTKGGSNTWDSRSRTLDGQSGPSEAGNDASVSENGMVDKTSQKTYLEAMVNITNDAFYDASNTRLLGTKDHGTTSDDTTSGNLVKATLTNERLDASNDIKSTTRIFVPVENTLLQAFHAHTSPTSAQLAKKLEAILVAPPSPTPNRESDVISLHSTDEEGEDGKEATDVAAIQKMLFPPTKLKEPSESSVSSPAYSGHNSLFSPGPSEEVRSSIPLFTPKPSRKSTPKPTRERAVCVDVPALPGPKSEYRWMLPPRTKKPRPAVKIFQSLEDAYAFAMYHNNCGVTQSTAKTKQQKEERLKPQNAVAGSSKHPIVLDVLDLVSDVGSAHLSTHKKRVHKDDGTLKDAKKKQKHTHVDIDLTISDDEKPRAVPKPKLPPKPDPPRLVPTSNRESDSPIIITVGLVKPVDFQIWDLNTRFLRKSIMQRKKLDSISQPELASRRKTGTVSGETPWFCRIPSSQLLLDEEEISQGGKIPTSWDISCGDVAEENIDDNEVIFVESLPMQRQQQSRPQPRPFSVPSSSSISTFKAPAIPRKIDLAARLRKKEQSKGKSTSTASISSTRHNSHGSLKPVSPLASLSTATRPSVEVGPSPSQIITGTAAAAQREQSLDIEEALGPITPSAKALGKRKAVDTDPYDAPLPLRAFGFPSSHDAAHLQHGVTNSSSTNLEYFRNPNPDIFIHNYERSPSPILHSPTTAAADANTQTLASLYTSTHGLHDDISQYVPTFVGVPEHGFVDPWDIGVSLARGEYQFATVDPTLLLGGSSVVELGHEPSESLPDYAADFALTDEEDSIVELQPAPVAGPSGVVRDRSRSVASSPSVTSPSVTSPSILEFPSSTENTSEKEYVPSNPSTSKPPKSKKRQAASSYYVSSSDSDDEPLANSLPLKHKEREATTSSMASDKDYVPSIKSNNSNALQKPRARRSSSSSIYVSEGLPEVVYVPSTAAAAFKRSSLSKATKVSKVNEETSSDQEYVPSTKPTFQQILLPKRKTRRAVSSSLGDDDDNVPGIKYMSSATPVVQPDDVSLPNEEDQMQQSVAGSVRSLPKRQRVQTKRQDFINIDTFLSTEGKDAGSSTGEKLGVAAKPTQKAKAYPISEFKRSVCKEWPQVDEKRHCHQCRRGTFILKMHCPKCIVAFCIRCLTNRYPDRTFFEGVKLVWTRNCPRCEGYCNCTACCSKRGETYVSARGKPPGRRILSTPASTPAPIPALAPYPEATAQPLLVVPRMPQNAIYFAKVYDMKGKSMGATYISADDLPAEGFAVPSITTSLRARTKRTFVGSVQRSWNFAKHSWIKDLKPLPPPKPPKLTKGKKIMAPPKMRHFIGSDKFIKYRKKSEPYDPFGYLSSLSSLTSDEEDPVPEEPDTDVEAFNPQSLTDRDVCRAITVSLQACGVRIVSNGPTLAFVSSF